MKCRFGLILGVMGLILVVRAGAQDAPDPGEQVSGGPTPTYLHPELLPSLDYLSQTLESSGVTLGIQAGSTYDSAGAAFSPTYGAVTRLYVLPTIDILQIRPKFTWDFHYVGGLTAYPSGQQADIFANNASADILYQLAPHWQVHANDKFTYTNDPFGAFYGVPGTPSANDPNPTVYYPAATRTQNYGVLDLTNQLTAHDTLTFSGTESFRRYSNQSGTTTSTIPFVENLVSYGGRSNYSHNFTPRLSIGGGYNYQSLDFGHGQQRSGVQNIQFTIDYQISPSMTVSGWIGPEYTSTKNIVTIFIFKRVIHESQWSAAGGASFGWKGTRDAFRASYSQQVTDGGGIIGTTQLYMVNADYRRRLASRWDLTTSLLYGNNISVSQLISANKRRLQSVTTSANVTWRLTPSFDVRFLYAYIYETQKNIYAYPTYSDNRVGITLQYSWGHSLGR